MTVASVMDGSTRCQSTCGTVGPTARSYMPPAGKYGSPRLRVCTEKKINRSRPSQKLGIEIPTNARVVTKWSNGEYWCTEVYVPRTIAATRMIEKATTTRSTSLGKRSEIGAHIDIVRP